MKSKLKLAATDSILDIQLTLEWASASDMIYGVNISLSPYDFEIPEMFEELLERMMVSIWNDVPLKREEKEEFFGLHSYLLTKRFYGWLGYLNRGSLKFNRYKIYDYLRMHPEQNYVLFIAQKEDMENIMDEEFWVQYYSKLKRIDINKELNDMNVITTQLPYNERKQYMVRLKSAKKVLEEKLYADC